MPLKRLIMMMLPGMLPLLAYVLAAELWGELAGLQVGIALGLVEFFIILIRQRRIDWFVVLDTLLLLATGAVSLLLDDAFFFKLKPVILEALLVLLVGFSAFGSKNLVMGMALRGSEGEAVRKQLEGNAQAARAMAGTLRVFTVFLAIHTALTLVAAIWWSKEVWLFISGPALYIFMGIWFLVMVIRLRLKQAQVRNFEAAKASQSCTDPD